jgi:hypothetical protein
VLRKQVICQIPYTCQVSSDGSNDQIVHPCYHILFVVTKKICYQSTTTQVYTEEWWPCHTESTTLCIIHSNPGEAKHATSIKHLKSYQNSSGDPKLTARGSICWFGAVNLTCKCCSNNKWESNTRITMHLDFQIFQTIGYIARLIVESGAWLCYPDMMISSIKRELRVWSPNAHAKYIASPENCRHLGKLRCFRNYS